MPDITDYNVYGNPDYLNRGIRELERDGLARRAYVFAGALALFAGDSGAPTGDNTTLGDASQIVLYRASPTCQRAR